MRVAIVGETSAYGPSCTATQKPNSVVPTATTGRVAFPRESTD
jgi:hypothetical protein